MKQVNRVACIGEVMIELMAHGMAAQLGVAGDTYNTAVYLARAGVAVEYMSVLGTDGFSDRILSEAKRNGIGTTYIERRADKRPGLYAIETDSAGERSFTYWRSESAARHLFADDAQMSLAALEQFDLVVLSGITLAILPTKTRDRLFSALDGFRKRGGLVAYDSNHRPHLWANSHEARAANIEMWARCDIALPSLDDECAIHGDRDEASVLRRFSGLDGALKRGAAGPLGLPVHPGGVFHPAAVVLDTTAAGDSFNAGYLAAIVQGKDQRTALEAGHELALHVIGHPGAIAPASDPSV